MQQSVTLVIGGVITGTDDDSVTATVEAVVAFGVGPEPPPKALNWRRAFTLWDATMAGASAWKRGAAPYMDSLERIGGHLPIPINFNPHLDAPIHLFGPTLIIHPQLNNVTILYRKRPRFVTRPGQAEVIQKRARGRFGISHVEASGIVAPQFGMGA